MASVLALVVPVSRVFQIRSRDDDQAQVALVQAGDDVVEADGVADGEAGRNADDEREISIVARENTSAVALAEEPSRHLRSDGRG